MTIVFLKSINVNIKLYFLFAIITHKMTDLRQTYKTLLLLRVYKNRLLLCSNHPQGRRYYFIIVLFLKTAICILNAPALNASILDLLFETHPELLLGESQGIFFSTNQLSFSLHFSTVRPRVQNFPAWLTSFAFSFAVIAISFPCNLLFNFVSL